VSFIARYLDARYADSERDRRSEQARRVAADGESASLRQKLAEVTGQLEDTQASLRREMVAVGYLRHRRRAAELDRGDEGVAPTPQQLVNRFLCADDEQRLRWAEAALTNADAAHHCFQTNHVAQLDRLRAERAVLNGQDLIGCPVAEVATP
jgi:hypothetical protein